MADGMFNIARGAAKFYYYAVENSTVLATSGQFTAAADSSLLVVAINAGATTEDTFRDYDDLAALIADANVAEATNSGYARKVLTDVELAAVPAPDDVNNRQDLDIPDQTWTAVAAAGGAWTHLVICFRPAAASADSAIIPISFHGFAVTPDGSDIVAQINAAGFYRSS